jgi:hypothetical protein
MAMSIVLGVHLARRFRHPFVGPPDEEQHCEQCRFDGILRLFSVGPAGSLTKSSHLASHASCSARATSMTLSAEMEVCLT